MAIRLNKTGDHIQQGTVEYTADAAGDIAALPTGVTPGSECFCIEESKTYILNNNGEWKEKKQGSGGGSGGGGGSSYPSADGRSFPLYNDDVTLLTQSQYYNDIAKAINEKLEEDDKYTPAQMVTAINNIPVATPHYDIEINNLFNKMPAAQVSFSKYEILNSTNILRDFEIIATKISKTSGGQHELFGTSSGSGTRFRVQVDTTYYGKKLYLQISGFGTEQDHYDIGDVDIATVGEEGCTIKFTKIGTTITIYLNDVKKVELTNLDYSTPSTSYLRLFGSWTQYNWSSSETNHADSIKFRQLS